MHLLTSWTWRPALKPSGSPVPHPPLRLPLKMCGLFDTGSAGGILDVTSMDFDASAALSGNPFSPGGLDSADSALFHSLVCGDDDVSEAIFNSLPSPLISSLNVPEDHFLTDLPATDSMDAFLNLGGMLDQDISFDETTDINLLNANPSFDKMIYSLLGLESFSTKQPAFSDLYNLETPTIDKCKESIMPNLFEKSTFDSLLTTSVYNPTFNPAHVINEDHRKVVTFECVQTQPTGSGRKITSNLLSMETNACSDNIDSYVRQTIVDRQIVTDRQTVVDRQIVRDRQRQTASKKEKSAGFKKSKEKRKSKVCDLEEEAEMLILKNEKLRQKIAELEKSTKEMKAKLVASIAGKSPAYTLN